MVAKIGFHGARHFVDVKVKGGFLERGDHHAATKITQITARAARGALGMFSRLLGEIGAVFDGSFNVLDFP